VTPAADASVATLPADNTLSRATIAFLASLALIVVGVLILAIGIARQLRQY
jgi:hypothetical protein